MSHIFGLVIIVALASIALAQTEYPDIKITIHKSIPDYLIQYPDAEVTKISNSNSKGWTDWKYYRSDTRLAGAINTLNFQTPQDVSIEFTYSLPENEVFITKVELWITVDSNPADHCYITSIGTRNSSVSVWIQSKATKTFTYWVDFYGSKLIPDPSTKIQIADKIEDYLTLYPSAYVVQMNQAMYDSKTSRYYLGNPSDTGLMSTAVAAYSFPIVKDVALLLEEDLPCIGYVEVLLTESNVGNATAYMVTDVNHILSKIWIKSTSTTIFNYAVKMYSCVLR